MMVYLSWFLSATIFQTRTHAQFADSTGKYDIFQKEMRDEIEIMKLPT